MKQFDRRLRSSEQDAGRGPKRYIVPVAVFLVLLVAVVILFFRRSGDKVYNAYETLKTVPLSADSSVRFCAYDSGFISYGRDGAAAFGAGGEQRWNISYVMKNPIVSVCGTYAVVADKGGTQFYIVDGVGTASRFELTDKVAAVEVASQGVAAVMTTGVAEDHIYLYGPGSQQELIDIMTVTKNNGFPLALSLSQDGRKLVTSYVAIEGGSCISWITFYNFGEVGQNYVDNMVGSYSFEELVPEVEFVTNDIAMICGEGTIVFYRVTEVPKALQKEDFTQRVHSVFHSADYTGVVLEKAEGGGNELVMYQNSKGERALRMDFPGDYKGIYTSGEDIVCYSNGRMAVYNMKGKEKFHAEITKNVNAVFRVDDNIRYILVGDDTADIIRLQQLE